MNDSARTIDELGGPKKVAELLGIKVPGAIQRVSNWKRRGIPSAVLLKHHTIFHSLIWPDVAPPADAQEEKSPAQVGLKAVHRGHSFSAHANGEVAQRGCCHA